LNGAISLNGLRKTNIEPIYDRAIIETSDIKDGISLDVDESRIGDIIVRRAIY